MKNTTDWVLTDPDNQQYGRQLDELKFEFKENGKILIIDLDEYEEHEIEDIINSYGYTLYEDEESLEYYNDVYSLYGNSANWIIAECIFEYESGLY